MKRIKRIPYGREHDYRLWVEGGFGESCSDCGVPKGSLHDSDTKSVCDIEECPACHKQLMTCEHKVEVLKYNKPQKIPMPETYFGFKTGKSVSGK
jgi:hypothetical protein